MLSAHALGQHEGSPFILLQPLVGTLAAELPHPRDSVSIWTHRSQNKEWPLLRAVNIAVQLARALRYCHDDAFPGYRILHRDVCLPALDHQNACCCCLALRYIFASRIVLESSLASTQVKPNNIGFLENGDLVSHHLTLIPRASSLPILFMRVALFSSE